MRWGMMGVVAALLCGAAAHGEDEPYRWPLDLPRVLTSSFAEYRPGRYHMGIDLRTGAVGKKVYAAAEGYVSRIRCSPYGYGKAIYLQLDDGNSVVYAHLDDFAPALRAYLRRAQHDRETYTLDLYPDPQRFRVRRGDRIGMSGQTGIGVPHLHYEIRDRTGAPINPRSLGIDWPDTTAPVVRKAVVVPMSPETTLDGDVAPVVLDVRRGASGVRVTSPVAVAGPVAIGIDVVDPANRGATRLGVHRVRVSSAGVPVFELAHDRVTYANDQDAVVAYHPFLRTQGRFLTLWRWPDNESEIFERSDRTGAFDLSGESATLDVVVEDFHDNRTTLQIPLVRTAIAARAPATGAASGPGSVRYDVYGNWLTAHVEFSGDEAVVPSLAVHAQSSYSVPMRRIDARRFWANVEANAPVMNAVLHVEHPRVNVPDDRYVFAQRGAPSTLHRFGSLLLRTLPDTPYGTLVFRAMEARVSGTHGLRVAGLAYDLRPHAAPIDTPILLSFPLPDGASPPPRTAIYHRVRDAWKFQETHIIGGRLETEAKELGVYAVLEDTQAPVLNIQRPRDGESLVSARPVLRAFVRDRGSGIARFSATYNGRWILMEYDPERELLVWEQDEDLPPGPGELVIEIVDEAGNVRAKSVRMNVPAA